MLEWLRSGVLRMVFRVQGSLFRRHIEEDFEAEIEAHLGQLIDENIARGMSAAEARRSAGLRLGGMAQLRETHRERRGLPYLEAWLQDLRYAVRLLRKNPGLAATVVLILGIGIGLNTAVFTIYDSVALRLLPVKDAARVMRLMRWYDDDSRSDRFSERELAYVRDHARSFEGVAAAAAPIAVATETQGGVEPPIRTQLVSGNYFAVLGVEPRIGRTFLAEEDSAPRAHAVAVLSDRFWKRRFLADPSALGRTIRIRDTAFTVVGIAPESFSGTGAPPVAPDVWIPAAMSDSVAPGEDAPFQAICRRRPEASAAQANSELALLEKEMEGAGFTSPKSVRRLGANPATLFDRTGGGFEVFGWVMDALMLAVASVLLIGCLNLVNLLLARAMTRQREIAVRQALGAGTRRIAAQLATETAVLGLLGGSAGFLLSMAICRFTAAAMESKLAQFGLEPLFFDPRPSGLVFLYALGVSLATGIVVGLVPAWRATRIGAAAAMRQDSATLFGRRGRFRDILLAAQIAVCLVLLCGAGLFGRAVQRAGHADPGFDTSRLFVMELPDAALGATDAARGERLSEAVARLRQTPQVHSVALAFGAPLLNSGTGNFQPSGSRVSMASPEARSLFNLVSPEYFETVGIPLLRGRVFSPDEAGRDAPVVVISENTARRFWPGEDPLGKRISVVRGFHPSRIAGQTYTVIGVVKSVRSASLSKVDRAYIYFTQSYREHPMLLLRTTAPADAAAPLIRESLRGLDGALATQMSLVNFDSGPVVWQRWMTEAPAALAAILGALGLLLATVGIYGVAAYVVKQQTREIGVRMALGAGRASVVRLVFGQALKPVLWAAPLGLAGAAALSTLLGSMVVPIETPDLLFGVNPWSPGTFAAVIALVVCVVGLASWMPARRAVRIDPAASLRYE